jgi:hypothetical protein
MAGCEGMRAGGRIGGMIVVLGEARGCGWEMGFTFGLSELLEGVYSSRLKFSGRLGITTWIAEEDLTEPGEIRGGVTVWTLCFELGIWTVMLEL